jgi:hypothetical protein
MGGIGSGNWYRWDSKRTVDDCLALDVNTLVRDGLLVPGRSGVLTWSNTSTGKQVSSAIYSVTSTEHDGLMFRLSYRLVESDEVELPIVLQRTRPYLGGWRWWFTCPLIINGRPCRRRVGKLFLSGKYFGCRHCHGLTYRSCQEAHQVERLSAHLGCDPDLLRTMASV